MLRGMNERLTIVRGGITLVGERAGEGRPVLLLHAGGETRAVWRPVMTALGARGLASVAFDQRGHGESGGAPADGALAYGDDAKAMIAPLPRPVVVGASLGGFALMFALEALEAQVAGLVLVDVVPAPDAERARAYLSPRGGLGASPLVTDLLARAEDLTRIVRTLRLPIMLVSAGGTSPLGEAGRQQMRALAPHARVETVAKASHLIARDAPAELARLIGDFADDVGGRGS
jgi:pimeloyl-ACP methyl ester carboxylesterase